jgi:hypothetical protein
LSKRWLFIRELAVEIENGVTVWALHITRLLNFGDSGNIVGPNESSGQIVYGDVTSVIGPSNPEGSGLYCAAAAGVKREPYSFTNAG